MAFKDNLAALPEVQGNQLGLFDERGRKIAVIENAPGTAGSFRVYAALAAKYGAINVAAAQEGLSIYAEHTEDARHNPGRHPNIDRLLEIQLTGRILTARIE